MKSGILKSFIIAGAMLAVVSCAYEPFEDGPDIGKGENRITFVVNVPAAAKGMAANTVQAAGASTRSGSNGHGVTADYRNYNADADPEANGTLYGGYASAEAEAAAFERAVAVLSANYKANVAAGVISPLPETPGANAAPETRAISEAGEQDNRVDEIMILLFDPVTERYKDYIAVPYADIADAGGYSRKEFTATIPAGSYKALFFANAAGRISGIYNLKTGTAVSGGADLTAKTLSDMQNELKYMISSGEKYKADPNAWGYRPFVMVSAVETIDPSVPVDYTANPVELARNMAKINVTVSESVTNFTVSEIVLCDYSLDTYLCPAGGWWGDNTAEEINARLFAASGVVRPVAPMLADGANEGISYTVDGGEIKTGRTCVDEIFTFERPFAGSRNLCLLVRGTVTIGGIPRPDRWFKLELLKTNPVGNNVQHVNVLRNYTYTLNITAVNGTGHDSKESAYAGPPEEGEGLAVELEAAGNREGMNDMDYNGWYQLTVDRTTVVIASPASAELLKVYTDFAGGWSGSLTYIYNGGGEDGWLTCSPAGTSVANSVSPTSVTLAAKKNTGNIRKAILRLTAGALSKTVTIIQFPEAGNASDGFPDYVNRYVGAFWQSWQTSERLIRIQRPAGTANDAAIDGEWTAYVLAGRGWVSLDTKMTEDGGIWTANPDFNGNDDWGDPAYQVSGKNTEVSGTISAANPEIYFRIGLRSAWPSWTPRYGVVLLVCRSNTGAPLTQRIWIRQGENPDYLMRPEGDGINRPLAARLSPYNLTANTLNAAVADPLTWPRVNPAYFTDYPTQAGAFFQWANTTNIRYAWDPHTTGKPAGWNETSAGTYWSTLSATHETCPYGWRHLNDGSVDSEATGAVNASEARQSLWLNPQAGGLTTGTPNLDNSNLDNTSWGYYADGFFDRRKIVDAKGGTSSTGKGTGSSVSVNDRNIAHRGRVFYNPVTNASIFLPASGRRSNSPNSGELYAAGVIGHFHTTAYNAARSSNVSLNLRPAEAGFAAAGLGYAFSVRCVLEDYSYSEDPEFSVTPETMSFGMTEYGVDYAQTATVASNQRWRVVSAPDWITFTDDRWNGAYPLGVGDGSFSVAPSYDNSGDEAPMLTGVIRIETADGEMWDEIAVTQAAKPYLYADPDEYVFPSTWSQMDIWVSSNTEWQVVSAPEWINLSTNSGTGISSFTVTVWDNPNSEEQAGVIRIETVDGTLWDEIIVSQEGAMPYLSADQWQLDFYCNQSQNEFMVSVMSNTSWTVGAPAFVRVVDDLGWDFWGGSGNMSFRVIMEAKGEEECPETDADPEYLNIISEDGQLIHSIALILKARDGGHVVPGDDIDF